jgi:hypothetical protein
MKDFFTSYTANDEPWAVWIAWQLDQAGYYRSTTGLFTRAVGSEICPPDLATSQLWSSASRASAHSPSPCSARVRSSSVAD